MTTIPTMNPSDTSQQVRAVHLSLTALGLPSPLAPAVELLDRAAQLGFAGRTHVGAARAARSRIAREVALGELDLETAVAAWAAHDAWLGDVLADDASPAGSRLVKAATRAAAGEAMNLFTGRAGAVLDTIRAAARSEIGRLEALPEPPQNLWSLADPTQALVRIPEHAETLSVLAMTGDRFWRLQQLADLVRGPAGFGFERLPDGAPRSAAVYRNWRRVLADEGKLGQVHRSLRLWWATVHDWQPGIWLPEDIAAPTRAENTFSGRLARLGSAVGTQ